VQHEHEHDQVSGVPLVWLVAGAAVGVLVSRLSMLTVSGEDNDVDLSAMSFEERLEYLSANAPTAPRDKEEDDVAMFGIDNTRKETQWWRPEFFKLCFQDLREMSFPTRKQTVQTVLVSQAAFVLIIIFVIIFDAITEGTVRSLLKGDDFFKVVTAKLKFWQPK
jgi:preprotein translocase subunit SecE